MSKELNQIRKQARLQAHARRMRSEPSEPERVLWQALRCCRLGVQFRLQVVLHGYIVDFFEPAARLAVEVDGAQHAACRGADARRDATLIARGLRVLRPPARLVVQGLPTAVQGVVAALGR